MGIARASRPNKQCSPKPSSFWPSRDTQ